MPRVKIFFDGGCQPNPGRIELAVVARGVVHFFDDKGYGSSADAEWLALIEAVRVAHLLGHRDFDLIGDNVHVIGQANGHARCRSQAEIDYLARFREAAQAAPPRRIRWIARSQNLAGIALAQRQRLPRPRLDAGASYPLSDD